MATSFLNIRIYTTFDSLCLLINQLGEIIFSFSSMFCKDRDSILGELTDQGLALFFVSFLKPQVLSLLSQQSESHKCSLR